MLLLLVGQLFAAGGLQALNDTRASHAAGEANVSFETAEARAAAAEIAKHDAAQASLAASFSAIAEAEALAAFAEAARAAAESGGLQALNDTRDSLLASDAEGGSGPFLLLADALEIETFDPLDLVVDTVKDEASGEGVGKGPGIATAIPGSPVNSSGEIWLEEVPVPLPSPSPLLCDDLSPSVALLICLPQ